MVQRRDVQRQWQDGGQTTANSVTDAAVSAEPFLYGQTAEQQFYKLSLIEAQPLRAA